MGFIILVNKKLNFVVLNQFKVSQGRILVVEALVNGVKVILCNLYAPNKENTYFFHEVSKILGDVDGQIILGGDFNQTLDNHLDRSGARTDASPRDRATLDVLREELGLIDIWRLINPKEREYTFYSHSHRSYSRIDFFLVAGSLVDLVMDCNIGVIAITDHAPVELHIDLRSNKGKAGRWRLNTSLLQDEQFATKLGGDIRTFLDINSGTTERLATVWDALKAFIRGKCIAYSSWKKKDNKEKVQLLEKEIGILEKHLAEQYDEEGFRKICQLKFELHEICNKKSII